MATPAELLGALHDVFGNRDAALRRRAVENTFTEDATFTDPGGTVTGWDAVEAAAAGLLVGAPDDFELVGAGPTYTGTDIAAFAWEFGPAGAPVARGIDIITVRDGRVATLQTVLHE